MLTIGQMARYHGLSTKTLRHYDSIGLFCPALCRHDNGYRHYLPQQIVLLGRIVWLRRLGMSLDDICQLKNDGGLDNIANWRQALTRHATQEEAKLKQQQQRLAQLKRYLAQPEWRQPAMQIPRIIQQPAVRVIGMSWHCQEESTIAELWQRFVPQMGAITTQPGIKGSFGVCLPLADNQWRYLAALAVSAETPVPEGMESATIPAGAYAMVEHHGSVSTLPETFRAAYSEWLPAAGLQPAQGIEFEFCGERFLGPQHPDSVVEIYIPLQD